MSSNDKKKYWWYKEYYEDVLDHRRKCLKKVKHGYEALVILDELKKESVRHSGVLRFSNERAYTNQELANVLDEPIRVLEKSLQLLKEYDLIFIQKDNTIIVKDFQKRIGFTTGQAQRMRESRENNAQMCSNIGTNVPEMCPESRVKSLELRDKILNYLSSSKLIYEELNKSEQFEELVMMMTKAAEITNSLPNKDKLVELSRSLMDWKTDSSICNLQGYLINIFKNEGEKICK